MVEHDQIRDTTDLQANHEVAVGCSAMGNRRLWGALAALGAVCVMFIPVFQAWFRIAMGSDLHSHVILIPLVSAYLLATNRKVLPWDSKPSPVAGSGVILLAGVVIGWALVANPPWSEVDLIALKILAWVGAVWGIGILFMGSRWMRSAMFPMGFLLFMIPLPDLAAGQLERVLMVMSAQLSETLFSIGGVQKRSGSRAAWSCSRGGPGVQWHPLFLGAFHHQRACRLSIPTDGATENRTGCGGVASRDPAQCGQDLCDRLALRPRRP
jgi:hypothetical protein